MARKSPQKPDRVANHRMQAIDDPTAAFPIGMLAHLVDDDEGSGDDDLPEVATDNLQPLDDEEEGQEEEGEEATEDEEESPAPQPSPGTIQVGYLLLSLLGGGIAAAMFAVVIVVLVLLL